MTQPPSDERLRQAHDALLAARSGVVDLPDVSVETIAALAQGTYREPDRILLLDRILAHPVTARELQFFRNSRPRPPPRRR